MNWSEPPKTNRQPGALELELKVFMNNPGRWGMVEREYKDCSSANSAARHALRRYKHLGNWEHTARSMPDGSGRIWMKFTWK